MHTLTMDIADELDNAMAAFRPGGISQAELSKLSGVPQPTISRTLRAGSTPETKTLIKLAAALKCSLGGYNGTEAESSYPKGTNVTELKPQEPEPLPIPIAEIVRIAMTISTEGQYVLLGRAQEVALQFPAAKANHSA